MIKKILGLVENLTTIVVGLVAVTLFCVGIHDVSLLVFGALFLCIGIVVGLKLGKFLRKQRG